MCSARIKRPVPTSLLQLSLVIEAEQRAARRRHAVICPSTFLSMV